MSKKLVVLLTATLFGGWFFFDKFEISGLQQIQLKRRPDAAGESQPVTHVSASVPPAKSTNSIRIASFNIQTFGDRKASKSHVMERLAEIVRQFDIVAIQEIRTKSTDHMARFIELINQPGRHYDHVTGERLGRTNSKEQYAYVFDRQTIEVDRNSVYTIYDGNDMLHREPLVAWFRVRGPPPNEAFTFKLVNMHTDPDEAQEEMNAMDDVYYAVANDRSGEDDIILLGDFNVNYRQIGQLADVAYIHWVISKQATNTRKTKSYDNLFFSSRATTEFMGRGGVLDFLREFNLTESQALEISDHLPVWAEFSTFEGGKSGIYASQPANVR